MHFQIIQIDEIQPNHPEWRSEGIETNTAVDVGITSHLRLKAPPTHSAMAHSPVLWVVSLPTPEKHSILTIMQLFVILFVLFVVSCHCVTSSLDERHTKVWAVLL